MSEYGEVGQQGTLNGLNVLYRDKAHFEEKLNRFKEAGINKCQIISDFDFTLSRYFQEDGSSRSASCHMVLEKYKSLPSSYTAKATALQQHYHPIENDMSISKEEKYQHMADWANKANDLFREAGLTKDILHDAVQEALDTGIFRTRQDLKELLQLILDKNVPLLLFSAGLANVLEHAILRVLHPEAEEKDLRGMVLTDMYENVNVISNRVIWDKNGGLIDFSSPVLHVMNKSCTAFLDTNPHFALCGAARSKLFLFGDSLGDLKMSIGLDYLQPSDIIKVGFLNAKDHAPLLPKYLDTSAYDLVILGDPSLQVHLALLKSIIGL